jgi:hypothetical protein
LTRAKPKPARLSERDIERTCSDFLALDGWRCLKTDPVSDRSRAKGFGEVGMADCLYIRYSYDDGDESIVSSDAEALWIEWKTLDKNGKPTKASRNQLDWHRLERKRGALTWITGEDFPASIEGFLEFYRGSGLLRRAGA